MTAEIEILAFVQCLVFVAQVIALFVQYSVNRSYRGIEWWVRGSIAMALGVVLMPALLVKSLEMLAIVANPLVVFGQILIYIGIMQFVGKKEKSRILYFIYAASVAFYFYFIFFDNNLSARTVVINATTAAFSLTTAYVLFVGKERHISNSANFTACVFLIYGILLMTRALYALLLPPMKTYSDQGVIFIVAFIVPIIASTLWTYGFIIMLNQRLNYENLKEKEKIQQLVQQLEKERNTAQLNSLTDSLTGLANRRCFDEALRTEFFRLKRSGSTLSLIMLDVDYFKKFNDTYGHLAGDDCLRRIGNILKTIVGRAPDIAARYGGEEFIVILPETEKNGAISLAERIREDVQALAIPHSESDVSEYVTVSMAVLSVSTIGLTSPEQVVTMVDEALYRAKKGGRDRIEVANDDAKIGNCPNCQ